MEETPQVGSSVWVIEPRYTTIQFKSKLAFLREVEGRFLDLSGVIIRGESEIGSSSVEASINASTIVTGKTRRDEHLRSRDFLGVDEHPEIRFVSTSVVKGRDRDTLRVAGALTIRGKSKDVVLEVTEVERSQSPQGDEVAYYSAQAVINRHDYGVSGWRLAIGRKVKVVIHVQAVRQ